ncbi:MAG: hypothetical protein COB98_11880 [Flavobacteriaceae bacterium]|nr:MAG: hypothetical protein COB98_11880 [Flavobacteriaceae bacterium]
MRLNLKITAILGAIAVILGAFGAHALKETLTVDALKSFETGVRYQMYHVIVLLFVNGYQGFSNQTKNRISYLFFAGISCFSGSIYAISFGVPAKSIWFLTPLGGLLLILAWGYMLISFMKSTKN